MALASISIFGDFATNGAGNAAGGEAAQVALRQLLQPASILSFQGILPCKQQDQWRRDQDPRISGYVTRIAGSRGSLAGWVAPGPVALQAVPRLTELVAQVTSVASSARVVLRLEVVSCFAVGNGGLSTGEAEKTAGAASLQELLTSPL